MTDPRQDDAAIDVGLQYQVDAARYVKVKVGQPESYVLLLNSMIELGAGRRDPDAVEAISIDSDKCDSVGGA